MTSASGDSAGRRLTRPPSRRLIRSGDFRRAYALRASVAGDHLIVYAFPNDREVPRCGLSVGRKLGGAVARNRIKRRLREAARLAQGDLPAGFDLVLIPRSAGEPPMIELRRELVRLAGRAAERARRKSSARDASEAGD